MNGQIRKILREFMLRNRTLHWRQYLERATEIKNSQRNGMTKQFPNKVWRPGHIDRNGRIENRARRNIDIQIQKDIAKNKAPLYNNGDLVRVKMTALFSDLRKKVKEGKKKEIIVRYSPDVYRVKIWNRNFDAAREKQQYTLETLDNPPQSVLTEFKANNPNRVRGKKRFFATDFLKVNADDDQLENDYTMEEANRLNKIPNGTHLIPNPQQPEPDNPEPEEPEPEEPEPETSPTEWKTKEWNEFLKHKTFEDEGEEWIILKVQYNRRERNYTCDIIRENDVDDNHRPKRGADINEMLLWEVLDNSRGERWYRNEFNDVIRRLDKTGK
jgi:hypothetical protein